MDKLRELAEEFRAVFSGRGARWFDALVPLLVFLAANPRLGLQAALWGAVAAAVAFAGFRLMRREPLLFALGGLGATLLAALLARLSGSETGFYVPGLVSGALTATACAVSVLLKRPLAAYSSFLTRRWPLDWYWHPQVLPAYREVTIFWAAAFAGRLGIEIWLFAQGEAAALGAARVFLGWPFIILVLAASYLYGLQRLRRLGGPSVAEFKAGAPPPWEGQQRGF